MFCKTPSFYNYLLPKIFQLLTLSIQSSEIWFRRAIQLHKHSRANTGLNSSADPQNSVHQIFFIVELILQVLDEN